MQKLSNRKIKYLRLLAVLVVLIIVVVTAFGISALRNAGLRSSMLKVDVTALPKELPIDNKDAADSSAFTEENSLGDGAHKVAENESLILYIEDDYSGIRVYDKVSKHGWYSRVLDNNVLENGDISDTYKAAMQSFMTFSYIDLSANNTKVTETASNSEVHTVEESKIFGGAKLTFIFSELNLTVAVNVTIDGSSLQVEVLDKEIIENQPDKGGDNVKKINEKIKLSNSLCSDIKNFAANGNLTSSEKMLIEMSADEIMKILVSISGQVDSGAVDDYLYSSISMSMDSLMIMAYDYDELNELYNELQTTIAVLQELTLSASANRCTGITELAVLPYFGNQILGTDGYAFYPDGSGAISYFDVIHPTLSGEYAQRVYDRDRNDASFVDTSNSNDTSGLDYISPTTVPVYGVKANNSAFVAVITKGDYEAQINYVPCTAILNISNVYGSFHLRQMSSVVNSSSATINTYDTNRTVSDWTTRYWFLQEEKANYSGMAETYRNYLMETEQLKKASIMDSEQLPLVLMFYIGLETESQGLNSDYITMSTFEGVQNYIDKLSKEGIKNQLLYLDNWFLEDINSIVRGEPSKEAGGQKAINELANYMNEKKFPLILENSLVEAAVDDVNSAQMDIVTVKNKSLLTLKYDNTVLFNPTYVYNRAMTTSKTALQKIGVNGWDMGDTSKALYFDYNSDAVSNRAGTAAIFKQLSNDAGNVWNYISGENVNSYLLNELSWNRSVPEKDSGFLYTDEPVPFIQMLIHGSMIYTGTPFNEIYDAEKQLLKAIEYGYVPSYFLTEESPLEISGEGLDHFYSTQCSVLEEDIINTYKKYNNDLSDIWNRTIINHERLSENVFCTTYDEGTKVIVNYSNKDIEALGVTVGAESYTVLN